jgi:hypothetical protein
MILRCENLEPPTSQSGQKATFPQLSGMSALLPRPDVAPL